MRSEVNKREAEKVSLSSWAKRAPSCDKLPVAFVLVSLLSLYVAPPSVSLLLSLNTQNTGPHNSSSKYAAAPVGVLHPLGVFDVGTVCLKEEGLMLVIVWIWTFVTRVEKFPFTPPTKRHLI